MALETTPPSVGAEDNLRIKFVTTIADVTAPTVTEWESGQDITYSLTPDGWQPTQDQAVTVDDRLTLAQALERPGKKTKSLTLRYVYGGATEPAADELVEGTAGYFMVRPGIANETAGTAAQKVTIWPVLTGEQVEEAPPANGVFTISQKCFVTGAVVQRVALVAP
jgi:hypothetical protein